MRSLAALLILLLASPVMAQPSLRERMLLAEDARAQTDAELAPLREGLNSRDPKVRRQAVRGIGRLERADLIPLVTRVIGDPDPDVRIEAANALGQLARGPKGVADAKSRLVARTRVEREPRVWAVVAATLGRLPYTTAEDVQQAEAALARVLPTSTTTATQIDEVLGAVEGLESLARQSGKISRLSPATINGLRAATELEGRAQDAEKLARIRRLASLTLMAAGGTTRPELESAAADPDEEVRRLAMVAARTESEERQALVDKGLKDSSPRVRYEALQTWGRHFRDASCTPVIAALDDSNPHVSLLAIDLLGNGCPESQSAGTTLEKLADIRNAREGAWHVPAHALVSLARVAPDSARTLLPSFAAHTTWQVRMYAARAAAALGSHDTLTQLGRDVHDNVREAALDELIKLKRPEAVALSIEALARPDYQLLLTAARGLTGAPNKTEAIRALTQALARVTAERRETSRDPRMAILERLQQLAGEDGSTASDAAAALEPCLRDFDPVVAAKTAEILRAWQRPRAAAPRPLPRPAVSLAAAEALRGARLRFTMRDRGAFELNLLIDEAPLSVLRVARRARDGYYNGLTFHRVVPNFVVQGGSPGANEYMGDGPYMRDEVGLVPHRRGAVGISTRGRDTGDAQLFINLVDLPRLEHTYTVFAQVAAGMEVVDALVEGDVIERVDVIPAVASTDSVRQ
jgi:cyclophilin family peptidyl-prolyl cis-trans isomerase/HEAT repeat protein